MFVDVRGLLIVLSVLLILPSIAIVGAQEGVSIKKLSMYVDTEPSTNVSYVETVVELSSFIENGVVAIPVINDVDSVLLIKVYGSTPEQNFSALYNESSKMFEVFVYNTSVVTIEYLAYGLFYESGFDTYSAEIDLVYENIGSIYLELRVPEEYSIIVITAGMYSVNVEEGKRVVKLLSPDLYVIVATRQEEITIPPTSPSTLTPSTSPTTTPATTPTTETSPTTTTSQQGFPLLNYLVPATLIVVAIIALLVYMFKRRGGGVEIEHVSPTDIFSDDIVRDIVLVVGGEGDRGIQQNRLVNILGKPKSTISRKIRRLSEQGYVIVERAGRSNIIKLTDKGWEAYRKLSSEEKS